MVQIVNGSEVERFDELYGRLWLALRRGDDPDLSEHERQVLHHVVGSAGIPLTWLARHLGLPKSTTSVLVKDLANRGFVRRARDARDERRVLVTLTAKGRRRVQADSVLDLGRLGAALRALPTARRAGLLRDLERLVETAEADRMRAAGRA